MCHRKTYMYINFQQHRVIRSVKTVLTNLFAKIGKLQKFVTTNSNCKKSKCINLQLAIGISKNCDFGHALPPSDIQANFEINRPSKLLKYREKKYFHRQ